MADRTMYIVSHTASAGKRRGRASEGIAKRGGSRKQRRWYGNTVISKTDLARRGEYG